MNTPQPESASQPIALKATGLSKRYGNIQANEEVSLTLHPGFIHALLGENGAGKSTLVSMLYGLVSPDAGTIELAGKPVQLKNPAHALHLGIGLVQQHFSLIPAFTVLENIILGQEMTQSGFLTQKQIASRLQQILDQYDLKIPLHRPVESLTVGEQQQVEIAKILYRGARIMLFDEPTAALVPAEIERFLASLNRLKAQGIAIVLITHRLPEVMAAADEVTILRKGKRVLHQPIETLSEEAIGAAMLGETLEDTPWALPETGVPFFEILQDEHSALLLHRHEILGVAAVAGNGQEEWIDAILGMRDRKDLSVNLLDEDLPHKSLFERRSIGIAYIPQDRRGHALLPDLPIIENYMLNAAALGGTRAVRINQGEIEARIQEEIAAYAIQTPSLQLPIQQLSGGHQQRVVISRELMQNPELILAHNPTRGLDIRATRFVYQTLVEAAHKGAGVLLFSSELNELFSLCHSIAVLYRDRIVGIRHTARWSMAEVGNQMIGGKPS
ncbi:MAG: ATP-binding cassette domain-containing protein [bacterium]|jgi:simple sugar transport system ATP-binding protein|nr:ATP-binding cassette domain-containing protein [bacterium]